MQGYIAKYLTASRLTLVATASRLTLVATSKFFYYIGNGEIDGYAKLIEGTMASVQCWLS